MFQNLIKFNYLYNVKFQKMAKQKPLSNVERQRKFRANVKASEEKHQRYLAAEKKRWQERKEAGKIKCVATMPKRELRAKRRDWAKIKRTQRQKKKDAETLNLVLEQCVTNLPSPPRTPQINIDPLSEQGSRQSIQGRKKIRRDRSKSYREIQRLRTENEKLRKEAQKFKKRNQRLLSTNRLMCNNTPRSKTKKMLIGCRVTAEVRRSLLFHNVTVEVMKNKYAEKKQKNKKIIRDIFLDRLLIKYKLKKDIRKNIGIRYRSSNMTAGQNERRGLAVKCVENVRDFLQRDSNSRITTGKRDTITQKSDKRQRRVLLDSLRNLHIKYCAENSEQKMSFSLFCKIKPFHVRKATGRDRDTCLCRIHENGQLMLDRLHQIKLISAGPDNVDKCVECICCPGGKEDCYSRQCEICKNNVIVNSEDDTMVWWWEWDYVINNVMVRGEMKCVRKMVKMRREGNVMELCNRFQEHLSSRLCPHIWRIWRQRSALKKLREEGGVNRIIMIIDFSENYNAKYARETQATHFGASQVQITLHTGVAYINNKPVSFCSVSPSYEHNPSAIWAHLMPVLQQLKDEHPNVCSLDIWSDGPTTQYRNKQNFRLLSHIAPRYFSDVTWNMFEAGHGKGPADAVGGVVKRMADDKVLRGADIPDAKALFDTLTTSSAVRIFYVDESAIRTVSKMIPKNLTAVKGTMNLHQITLTNTVGLIAVRNVSCFCNLPSRVMCSCYQPREVQLPVVSRFVASSSVSLPDVPIILEQTKLTRTAVKKACATKVSTIIDLQAKSIRIRKPTEKAATITKQQAMLIRSRASTKKCVSRIDTNVRQQLKPTRTRTTSSPGVVIRKPAYLMPSFTPLLKRVR